jgi:hypothetical protein
MSAISDVFREQAPHCLALGSPFMHRLMELAADHWPLDEAIATRFTAFSGDIGPKGASLPLRFAGALHALVLTGRAPYLAEVYPPHAVSDAALLAAIKRVLSEEEAFVLDWVDSPPQTNEVRRSATLLAVASHLATQFPGLPFRLSELGASAGLNLMFEQFALETPSGVIGQLASPVRLTPEWSGDAPQIAPVRVTERRGVDLIPINPNSPEGALRLLAYLWPDQSDRLARTRAAIDLAQAPVDAGDAAAWIAARLATPVPGQIHLIYHTIAWQYFPAETQATARASIEAAGAQATPDAPLAWFGMEADTDSPGAALTLRLWPGNCTVHLGRVDFHGRWVDWRAIPAS